MERELNCLRCGTAMEHLADEQIQLGETGFWLGHLSNLLAGALDVAIYVCPGCKKLEFFYLSEEEKEDGRVEHIDF